MDDEEYKAYVRDRFAQASLRGLLPSRATTNRLSDGEIKLLAEDAYKMADGMLKAREAKP